MSEEFDDPVLRRALENAPDAAVAPDWRIRRAIQQRAREAVEPRDEDLLLAPMVPLWKRLLGFGGESGRSRMPWNAAFATVLVGVIVTALWQHEPVPEARLDGEAKAGAGSSSTPSEPTAPSARDAAITLPPEPIDTTPMPGLEPRNAAPTAPAAAEAPQEPATTSVPAPTPGASSDTAAATPTPAPPAMPEPAPAVVVPPKVEALPPPPQQPAPAAPRVPAPVTATTPTPAAEDLTAKKGVPSQTPSGNAPITPQAATPAPALAPTPTPTPTAPATPTPAPAPATERAREQKAAAADVERAPKRTEAAEVPPPRSVLKLEPIPTAPAAPAAPANESARAAPRAAPPNVASAPPPPPPTPTPTPTKPASPPPAAAAAGPAASTGVLPAAPAASSARAAKAAPASTVRTEATDPPTFAALSQWTRLTIAQSGGESRSLSRAEGRELLPLIGSAAISAVGAQRFGGGVEWRLTFERDGKVLAVLEVARDQVRWREGAAPPATGAPSAAALAALARSLGEAVAPRPEAPTMAPPAAPVTSAPSVQPQQAAPPTIAAPPTEAPR